MEYPCLASQTKAERLRRVMLANLVKRTRLVFDVVSIVFTPNVYSVRVNVYTEIHDTQLFEKIRGFFIANKNDRLQSGMYWFSGRFQAHSYVWAVLHHCFTIIELREAILF